MQYICKALLPLAMRAAGRMYNNLANGVAYGIGDTEQNSLGEYGKNIGLNAIGAAAGTYTGNKLFGRNNEMAMTRGFMSSFPTNFTNNAIRSASSKAPYDDEELKWW